MRIIKLELDYGNGPIWHRYYDAVTKRPYCGVECVDEDIRIQSLNDEIQKMYSSYFEFNSHNQGCWFNADKEFEEAPKMLELIEKLKARLEEINDGSYVVEDYLSEELIDMLKANGKL